ncbi:MAG: hypothetical protein HUU15_08410, partial [Candidatus Brocadiae bacterium]|nr:hypothetical protein [Candidatus Brocadiia bacterium]
LPDAERDWFEGERRRLAALSQERREEFRKRFGEWAGATEEERKAVAELGRSVAPADLAEALLASLEGADAAGREAAAKVVEAASAIVIPAEDGEPRRQALESWKQWVTRNTP